MSFRNKLRPLSDFLAVLTLASVLLSLPVSSIAQRTIARTVARDVTIDDKEVGKQADYTEAATVACEPGKFTFTLGPGTVVGSGHGNSRTYTGNGVDVTIRAFSRIKDGEIGAGTWETATVGQWNGSGAGLGVINRSSGEGSSPHHKVDNVGTRLDYLLFEFDQNIEVDTAYLTSISTDSDMRVWFGSGGSITSLSDAILTSYTTASNSGNAASATRTADLSSSTVSGNKFVIAAETLNTTDFDDFFKVAALDYTCDDPGSPTPNLIIVKQVQTIDGTGASPQSFGFTSTNTSEPIFSLVDANDDPPSGLDNADLIVNSGSTGSVTENVIPGWTLSDLVCTSNVPGSTNFTTNLATRTITATPAVASNEVITCTFTNLQLRTSAAPVSVTGRAMLMSQRGIGGAVVTVQDLSTGQSRSTTTNTFGYYTIGDLEVGGSYLVTISHRRYRFPVSSQFVTLDADLTGADFTGGF